MVLMMGVVTRNLVGSCLKESISTSTLFDALRNVQGSSATHPQILSGHQDNLVGDPELDFDVRFSSLLQSTRDPVSALHMSTRAMSSPRFGLHRLCQ